MNARRVARTAGVLYIASAPIGMALAVRDGLVAEPLGIRTGLPVREDLLTGNGTAVSAPPPMLLGLAGLLRAARSGRRGTLAVLAGLSAVFVAGQVAEPITHDVVRHPAARPAQTALVVSNIVLPAATMVAALIELAREEASETAGG